MDKRLPPTKFCVDTLLPQGLCILGGSPKVGKSWLVLDLCVHIAQGSPLWELDVTKGEVLYLCLEDSERRIQERLNTVTDSVPESKRSNGQKHVVIKYVPSTDGASSVSSDSVSSALKSFVPIVPCVPAEDVGG